MRIILVRPRDPNNIGAVARAMANFGVDDLVVVSPFEPVWREARSAVGAGEVLAGARVVDRFEEALEDRVFTGATTAARRRALGRVLDPEAFWSEALRGGPGAWDGCALAFGNEKHGLRREEIDRCSAVVRIPTASAQPSMNLAQAVAVCCYEAARARRVEGRSEPSPRGERLATLGEIESLVATAFPDDADRGVAARRRSARALLRGLLLRARPTAAEVALLRGLAARGLSARF